MPQSMMLVTTDAVLSEAIRAACLGVSNVDVTVVKTGPEATQIYVVQEEAHRPFDVLVIDLGTEGVLGWNIAGKIRTYLGSVTPVILVAASGTDGEARSLKYADSVRGVVLLARPLNIVQATLEIKIALLRISRGLGIPK